MNTRPPSHAINAARTLVSGAFTLEAIIVALTSLRHGRRTKLLTALARRLVRAFGEGKRPRIREVARLLQSSAAFHRLFPHMRAARHAPAMQPASGAPEKWDVPAIATVPELCTWLRIDAAELHGLAAPWRTDHERGHYRHRWIPRRRKPPRLIEMPFPILKAVQKRILHGILNRIPAHPAAHGFVKARGIVSFATPHTGRRCVLRMDVEDFFPTIRRGRVLRVFLTAGYPEPIAGILANLCTTITPAEVLTATGWGTRSRLRERHLPQGAPTSPALANLSAFRLDARLAGLAVKFGANYTRYADDFLISGGDAFRRAVRRCEAHAGAILIEEGFVPAHRKTRIMPSSASQRAVGLVLNEHLALPRRERDRLKAILTNCVRHGPESQNRCGHPDFRAHLLGCIAHVAHVNPASAIKLRALFEAIGWSNDPGAGIRL